MNYAEVPKPSWINSYNWKHWIKKTPYKIDALIRDNYRCVDCHNGAVKLIVHHIDETGQTDGENNNLSNLVTLCRKCHSKRHGFKKDQTTIIELLNVYSDKDKNLTSGSATIISRKVGLSRERIRQIANYEGFITRNNPKNPHLYNNCVYCGKKFKKEPGYTEFCSSNCHKKFLFYKYWTITECKNCHKYFIVRRSAFLSRGRTFCGKTCQGEYVAKTYGFGSKKGKNNMCLNAKYNLKTMSRDLPDLFTKQEFAKVYGYASLVTAYSAINDLIFKGVVERYDNYVKNLFRLKQKSVTNRNQ